MMKKLNIFQENAMKQINRWLNAGLLLILLSTFAPIGFGHGTAPKKSAPVLAESMALLPASDAIAVVDVARIVNELLRNSVRLPPKKPLNLRRKSPTL
jgi:hypothetical protein